MKHLLRAVFPVLATRRGRGHLTGSAGSAKDPMSAHQSAPTDLLTGFDQGDHITCLKKILLPIYFMKWPTTPRRLIVKTLATALA